MSGVEFSAELRRRMGLKRGQRFHRHSRIFAFCLTIGEVVVMCVCGVKGDFIGAYTLGSYLSKEYVLSRFSGE